MVADLRAERRYLPLADVVTVVRLVEANAEFLLEQWRAYHDT